MMMKRLSVAIFVWTVTFNGFAEEQLQSLVVYDSAEACRGAGFNSWGGEKKGYARWDEQAKGLHLVWTNSVGTFALGSALERAVPEAITNAPGILRHVRVRIVANSFTQPLALRCQTPYGVYEHPMGVDPNGQDFVALVRPGGFSQTKRRFDWKDVINVHFYTTGGGSGDYVLKELALVFDTTPKSAPEPAVAADDFRLFPSPRVFRAGTDVWALSAFAAPKGFGVGAETAVAWLKNRVSRFYGEAFAAEDGKPFVLALANTSEGQAALKRLKLSKNFDRVKFDGFAVGVRVDGIDVVAANEMGLMNGARALMETIHLASGDAGSAQARAVTIVDWPRLKNRLFYTQLATGGQVIGGVSDPAGFNDLLERFVYPAKMNLVSLDLGPQYKYICDPGSGGTPGAWTPAELTNMIDRINAVGVKAVPFYMSPGHQWPNLFHGSRNMHLSENGDCESLCLKHPETYPTLFAHMEEVAGACAHNPRYKADVFYTGGDEVRWRDRNKKGEECPRCRGIPRNQLILEHDRKLDAWCRKRGYRMLICADMYAAQHNGYTKFLVARIGKDLPKTIGLVHWSQLDWDELSLWQQRGHDNWRIMTGYNDDPCGQEGLTGNGIAMYTDRWWLSYAREGASGGYSPLAIAFAGADGWGEPPRSPGTLANRAGTWGNCLMRRWSRKPIPQAGRDFAVIDLNAAAQAEVKTAHDFSTKELAGVPCAFARAADGIRVVAADASEHVVKVGRRLSSLVFLQTARLAEADTKAFRDRTFNTGWTFGAPIATWRVAYADGTEETFIVRYGWNVGECVTTAEGHHPVYGRFIGDARYAWSDSAGLTAYSHEWVNPHPEKEIVSLTLEKKPTMVGYELWALTARATNERRWGCYLDVPPRYNRFPRKIEKMCTSSCDNYTVEEYRQANGPETYQRVLLVVPKNVQRPLPAVVVPYYFPEGMLGKETNVAFMADLVKRGYVVASAEAYHLTYDRAGAPADDWAKWKHAGEKLMRDYPEWTGIGKLTFDTRLLIDLVVADPRVEAKRVGIMGHSLGGKMAFYAGCLDPRIKVIVANDFGFGWDQTNWQDVWYWGEKLKKARAEGLDHTGLLSLAHGKPFCLIAGEYDDATSGKMMRAATGYEEHPERLKLVHHATGHRPPPAATQEGYCFLDTYLKN